MEWLELCRKFISIDTTPSLGTSDLVELIAKVSKEEGLFCDIQVDESQPHQENIVIRPSAEMGENELLLEAHLDTREPGSFGLWEITDCNPFNATIMDQKIYGLGSCDAKLDFVCKWIALRDLVRSGYKGPTVLVGTFGEDHGRTGTLRLMRKRKIKASRAFVGAPTQLDLLHTGKGVADIEISLPFSREEIEYRRDHDLQESATTQSKIFSSRPGMATSPQRVENAIHKMFEYLSKLPESLVVMEMEGGISSGSIPNYAILEFDVVGSLKDSLLKRLEILLKSIQSIENDLIRFKDPIFAPPFPTLNIGMLRTYEDHIKLRGCCRLTPCVPQETYERWMEQLRIACTQIEGSFRLIDYKPPFATSLKSDFVRKSQEILSSLDLNPKCGSMSVNNEASIFSRFGVDCLVFGPGKHDLSDTPEEHVPLDQIQKAIEFYRLAIDRMGR